MSTREGREPTPPAAAAEPEARPLTKAHIGTEKNMCGNITYYRNANIVRVKTSWLNGYKHDYEHKRGIVKNLSRQSRMRLLEKVAMTDNRVKPLFMTLTYPEEFPDPVTAKRKHFKVFIQRMMRNYENMGYLWRMEQQKRGAPHFHVFLWGVPSEGLVEFCYKAWYEVTGEICIDHFLYGCRIEEIRSRNGAMFYVSKYIAKVDDSEFNIELGRVWGCGGNIPMGQPETIETSKKMTYRMLRLLRRYARLKKNTVRRYFVKSTERWLNVQKQIINDIGGNENEGSCGGCCSEVLSETEQKAVFDNDNAEGQRFINICDRNNEEICRRR